MNSCREAGTAGVISAERKEKTEKSPLLFDLTTLQRMANRLFGFTAQQTLDYAQGLYEKKLITYPRTDSRYLTEDMASSLSGRAAMVMGKLDAAAVMEETHFPHRLFDNSKVTDHYALLPTAVMKDADLGELPDDVTCNPKKVS